MEENKPTIKKRLRDEYTATYEDNNLYTVPVYIGSEASTVSIIVDTGSQWTVIATDDCSFCSGTIYDPTLSTNYVTIDSETKIDLSYLKNFKAKGIDSYDNFYMDEAQSFGLSSFEFLSLTTVSGLNPYSGLQGMAR